MSGRCKYERYHFDHFNYYPWGSWISLAPPFTRKKNTLDVIPVQPPSPNIILTFEEVNVILAEITGETLNHEIRRYNNLGIRSFKNFAAQTTEVTQTVLSSVSPFILEQLLIYYDEEYLIKIITRNVVDVLSQYIEDRIPKNSGS